MADTFFCPDGPGAGSPFAAPFNGEAHWRPMPDGSRTCSFCGSLHPDDFIEIMMKYADGEPGYGFSTTTKTYKVYGHRPGVQNASQGGIKFYGGHIPADRSEFDRHWRRAQDRQRRELAAR